MLDILLHLDPDSIGLMNEAAAACYDRISGFAEQIYERLGDELWKIGFTEQEVALLPPAEASYSLEKDPFSGTYALVGRWQNEQGGSLGSLVFHADGSFFVEQDVIKQHPRRENWFVEAINAWGRQATIQVEPKLLPMPE